MKKRKYTGPIVFASIGIISAIVVFAIIISRIDLGSRGSYNVDNSNNLIEVNENGTTTILMNHDEGVIYAIESKNDTLIVNVIKNSTIVSVSHIIFSKTQGNFTYEVIEVNSNFVDFDNEFVIGNVSSTGDGILRVDVEHITGDIGYFPLISVNEFSFDFSGFGYFGVFIGICAITFIGTIVYFYLIYKSRNKYFVATRKVTPEEKTNNTARMSSVELLVHIDRQFFEESLVNKQQAWLNYTAPYAVMGTNGDLPFIKGKEEIDKSITGLYQLENLDFRWNPQFGYLSVDGTLGVTIGFYKRSYLKNGENIQEKGKYISVWRNINGEWKIIFDMGN